MPQTQQDYKKNIAEQAAAIATHLHEKYMPLRDYYSGLSDDDILALAFGWKTLKAPEEPVEPEKPVEPVEPTQGDFSDKATYDEALNLYDAEQKAYPLDIENYGEEMKRFEGYMQHYDLSKTRYDAAMNRFQTSDVVQRFDDLMQHRIEGYLDRSPVPEETFNDEAVQEGLKEAKKTYINRAKNEISLLAKNTLGTYLSNDDKRLLDRIDDSGPFKYSINREGLERHRIISHGRANRGENKLESFLEGQYLSGVVELLTDAAQQLSQPDAPSITGSHNIQMLDKNDRGIHINSEQKVNWKAVATQLTELAKSKSGWIDNLGDRNGRAIAN